jgi:hypothetical protein
VPPDGGQGSSIAPRALSLSLLLSERSEPQTTPVYEVAKMSYATQAAQLHTFHEPSIVGMLFI